MKGFPFPVSSRLKIQSLSPKAAKSPGAAAWMARLCACQKLAEKGAQSGPQSKEFWGEKTKLLLRSDFYKKNMWIIGR